MVSETREASGSAQLFTFPFVAVTVLSFLMTACLQMTVSAMPLFVVELGMERSLADSATTVCTLASLFFRPASARMSDRQGELKTSLIAAGLLVVVFGCYFGCTRIWQIMVLRAAQGIGISMLSTSLGALATAIIPKQSITKGMSYYSLGNAVALSVGPAIGLALVGSGVYWHLFATGVAFACIMIALLLLMIRKPVGEGLQSKSAAMVGEPAQGFVRGMLECGGLPACGILMLLILSQTSLSTFLSFYAGTRGIESASIFFTMNVFGMVASKPFLGPLCGRAGNTKVTLASVTLLAAAFALVAVATSSAMLAVAGTLYGFGYGGFYTLLNVEAVRRSTAGNRGIANSLFFGAKDVGTAVGALAWGLISSGIGYGAMYVACAVIMLAAGLLLAAHYRRMGV